MPIYHDEPCQLPSPLHITRLLFPALPRGGLSHDLQTEHSIITAISSVPASDQAFLTADKSGEVSLWQVNAGKPAATLMPPSTSGDVKNASVITCLEVLANNLILAGTYGQGINVWDLRSGRIPTDVCLCSTTYGHCDWVLAALLHRLRLLVECYASSFVTAWKAICMLQEYSPYLQDWD